LKIQMHSVLNPIWNPIILLVTYIQNHGNAKFKR
jgi:hypothetical protein